jgi:hypothetical protein
MTCPKGHAWSTSWNRWHNGSRCRVCAGQASPSSEGVEALCRKLGWVPLDSPFIYQNCHGKFDVRCIRCGYSCKKTYNALIRGPSGCAQCSKQRPYTEVEALALYAEHGWVLPEEFQHINSKQRVSVRCVTCGHACRKSINDFTSGHVGCQKCAGLAKKTAEELIPIFESEGYSVAPDWQYRGTQQPIPVTCPAGHECTIRWNDWKNGHRCRFCGFKISGEKNSGSNNYMWRSDRVAFELDRRLNRSYRNVLKNFCGRTGQRKPDRTHRLLGYSLSEYSRHIKAHPNFPVALASGELSIDHVFPVQAFVDYGLTDVARWAWLVNSLDNLCPLPLRANLSAGDSYAADRFEVWLISKGVGPENWVRPCTRD